MSEPKQKKVDAQVSAFLISEIELSYKPIVKPSQRPKISNAKEAYRIFMEHWDVQRLELVEQFKVMFLNRANRLLGVLEISTGGTSGTVVDLKLVFAAALKCAAHAIIMCHNHPSGNMQPSGADIELTRKISAGAKLLDLQCVDHIIITTEGHFSFAEEGLL